VLNYLPPPKRDASANRCGTSRQFQLIFKSGLVILVGETEGTGNRILSAAAGACFVPAMFQLDHNR